jgi:AsmA protein
VHVRPAPSLRLKSIAAYALLVTACLAATVTTFVLVAAPGDLVKEQLAEQIRTRTGRDLVVAGKTSFSLYPALLLSLSDVSLSGPGTVKIATLEAEVRLWRLLRRRPAITRLVLYRPEIELEVDAQGRRSWDWAISHVPARMGSGGLEGSSGPGATAGVGTPRRSAPPVRLVVKDGLLRYRDERTAIAHDFEAVDATFTAESAGPVEADGSLLWRGERIAFAARAAPLDAALAGAPVQLTLSVSARSLEAAYEGIAQFAGGVALNGRLSVKTVSGTQAPLRFARTLTEVPRLASFAWSSGLEWQGGRLSLNEATATIGNASVAGSLAIDMMGPRPQVTGTLSCSELDLNLLATLTGDRTSSPGIGVSSPVAREEPKSREAADKAGEPASAPGRRSGGWSEEPFDLKAFGLADVQLRLAIGKLLFKRITLGQTQLAFAVRDRMVRLTLDEVQLYDGRGHGLLTLDTTMRPAVLGVQLAIDGFSAQPLLKDASGVDWLEGRGRLALAVAGQGQSEREIVESLNGNVDLKLVDGALTGIDVTRLVRRLERGRLTVPNRSDKTAFSELAATFTVANGLAHNKDLRLSSSHLQVSGSGVVNLGQRQIDYTVRPKLSAGPEKPTGRFVLAGLEVPIRVHGPWESPDWTPDLKGLSSQAAEALKRIDPGELEEAVKGLLGKDGERIKPRELLDKWLKR